MKRFHLFPYDLKYETLFKGISDIYNIMKIFNASHEIPCMSGEEDVENFLESRLNLQLATIGETGHTNIQPMCSIMTRTKINSTY
jgi:hypothetical protein